MSAKTTDISMLASSPLTQHGATLPQIVLELLTETRVQQQDGNDADLVQGLRAVRPQPSNSGQNNIQRQAAELIERPLLRLSE
jgi:hypothetical protein